MQKFKRWAVTRINRAGETFTETFDIRIDAEGDFYTCPSDDILGAVRTLALPECAVTKPRSNAPWRVSCPTFKGLERTLEAAIDEMLTVVETRERVIVYAKQSDVALWQNPDGSLHPNGYIGSEAGGWSNAGSHINASHKTPYFSIGLSARVFDQITYKRPNSQRVEFVKPDWGDHLAFSTWGARLNAFVVGLPEDPSLLDQMPYSEEAAEFFCRAMIEIGAMGIRLHTFFADSQNIQRAIERQAAPLLSR